MPTSIIILTIYIHSFAVSSKIEPFYKGGKVQVRRIWVIVTLSLRLMLK